MKIGIFSIGGANWIGGCVFLSNLIRACLLLPDAEKPEIFTLFGPKQDLEFADYIQGTSVLYYSHKADWRRWKKVGGTLLALKSGRIPVELDRVVRQREIDMIFPGVRLAASAAKAVAWIPDFQHLRFPEFFSDRERFGRTESFKSQIRQSDHLILSSQDALNDLARWDEFDPNRVTVLPFLTVPAPDWYVEDPWQVVGKYNLPEKFLIFPSQFWIHKNHALLFSAVAKAKRDRLKGIHLVCTGANFDYRWPDHFKKLLSMITELDLEGSVTFTGLLPRSEQIQLLRTAAAVVQPSLMEGWSSLVEDARLFGRPIFLSDIPVHREQVPPQAQYFDPKSDDSLTSLLVEAWPDLKPGPNLEVEASMRTAQVERAVNFARDFMGLYEKCRSLNEG